MLILGSVTSEETFNYVSGEELILEKESSVFATLKS